MTGSHGQLQQAWPIGLMAELISDGLSSAIPNLDFLDRRKRL